MAEFINSCEGGTHGVAVSVANSGGGSGDPFDAVVTGAGIYDTAAAMAGGLGHRIVPSSGVVREARWEFPASTTLQASVAFQRTATPSAAHSIMQFRSASAAVLQVTLQVTSDGRLILIASGTTVYNNAAANIAVDTPYRIEVKAVRGTTTGNGQLDFALYDDLDSGTPVATFSSSTVNLGTNDLTEIRFWRPSGGTTDTTTEYWDNYQAWSGADIPADLNNPFPAATADKIPPTLTRVSATEIEVSWTAPGDAPDGVTVIRADGDHETAGVDGLGRAPSHPDYDPLTISGAGVLAEGQTSPYSDSGLITTTYTYWLWRTAP